MRGGGVADVPGVHFATEFDPPTAHLEVPGELGSGSDPALRVVDGVVRGDGVLGRTTADPALLGIKVGAAGRALRLAALVRLDRVSLRWWRTRLPASAGDADPAAPRVLMLRSQGNVRAAALLAGHGARARRPVRALLCWQVDTDDVADDGLLLLELEGVSAPRLAPLAAVGCGLIRVEVDRAEPMAADARRRTYDAAAACRRGLLSTGDLPAVDTVGRRPLPAGALVVNPPRTADGYAWLVGVTLSATVATRVEARLPGPVAELYVRGPLARGRERVHGFRRRLAPLQAAAAREVRNELRLPAVATVLERAARQRGGPPPAPLHRLHEAAAVHGDVVALCDGKDDPPLPHRWERHGGGGLTLWWEQRDDSPVLVRLGVDHAVALGAIGAADVRWSVESLALVPAPTDAAIRSAP